ncbi:MFS transporter [Burkholderia stagnalis]
MNWIKRLGYFYNIVKGSESISTNMGHLMVGVLSGLPPFAVSLRVSIGFYFGALIEVPTGVLADVLGHRRTLIYGYAICAASSFLLFLSCHYINTSLSLMALVVSSVLSVLGGGLISGCLQAFLQDYIDLQIERSEGAGANSGDLREKALAQSQAYGNFFSAILPTLVLAALFVNYYVTGRGEWALFVPVVMYGCLSVFFYSIKIEEEKDVSQQSFKYHVERYRNQLRAFGASLRTSKGADQFLFLILAIRMVLSILTVIHVNTYLMVSQLRQIDLRKGALSAVVMGFFVLAAFSLANYPKGWLASFVSSRFNANRLMYFSLLSQGGLAALALALYRVGYTTAAVIIFVLIFNAVFSLGHTTVQSKLLANVPDRLRASVFSIIQTTVLMVYGSYSALLAATGIGVNRPDQIFVQLLVLVGLGVTLALAFDGIASSSYSRLPIDDTRA